MYTLKTESSFDSAHFLAGYQGKCGNLHGHRWRVVVEIAGDRLGAEGQCRGMLLDFHDFKEAVKALTEAFDHCLLIEAGSLREATLAALQEEHFRVVELPFRPTAENLARDFFDRLMGMGLPVEAVEVYETPNNCARYGEGSR